MPPTDVTIRLPKTLIIEGVELPAGDYPGLYHKRNAVNGPNGIAETWEIFVPDPHAPGVPTTGRVNATLHIRAGEALEL